MASFYRNVLPMVNHRHKLYRAIWFLVALIAVSGIAQSVVAISASPVSKTSKISIAEFFFNPPSVSIDLGDSVQWINNGEFLHTTTADGGAWNSGLLNPGGSFAHTFNSPGTFTYICSVHPFMVGTIIVQATVPAVVGLPQSDAEAAIVGAGLTVGDVTTAASDTQPVGSVISQNPPAGGSVAPGTAVDLVVSLGEAADVFCGDVHPAGGGDGDDDILDALRKLKIAVGLVTPDERELIAGDVHPENETGPDGDGDIDVLDALRDLKAAVGLVTITSCGGLR